jgi:hypothetical protein
MKFTIRHTFSTDADTYWNQIFFDEEYNRSLCLDYLKFSLFRVLSFSKENDGTIMRRLEIAPRVEIPGAIKKVLGDSANYVEEGTFDPVARRWNFNVIPHVASNKIKTRGEMWLEARGDKRVERTCVINTEVKVFGIGKMIEELIEKQTRASYDEAAVFTEKWIRDKGL